MGRRDVMQALAPLGPVYQAGTLSGHPIAMTAGLATLELVSAPGFYAALAEKTTTLVAGLNDLAKKLALPFYANSIGAAMFGLHFTENNCISSEKDVKQYNAELFNWFFNGMLAQGVYLAPSAFEIGFISSAHSDVEIMQTIHAAEIVLTAFAEERSCQELSAVGQD